MRRRYAVDNHLRRYSKALRHLRDMDSFEEFKPYMVEHQLYNPALSMYQYEAEKLNAIIELYADHLEKQSKFKDAGLGMTPSTVISYR